MARHWLSGTLGDGPVAVEGDGTPDAAGTPVSRSPRGPFGRGRGRRDRAPERCPSGPATDVAE